MESLSSWQLLSLSSVNNSSICWNPKFRHQFENKGSAAGSYLSGIFGRPGYLTSFCLAAVGFKRILTPWCDSSLLSTAESSVPLQHSNNLPSCCWLTSPQFPRPLPYLQPISPSNFQETWHRLMICMTAAWAKSITALGFRGFLTKSSYSFSRYLSIWP